MQDNPSYIAVKGVEVEPNPHYSTIRGNTGNEPVSGKGIETVCRLALCVQRTFVATVYNHVMRIITSLSPNKLIIAYNVLTAMQLSLLVLYTMYGMPKDPTPSKLPSMCHFIRRWADPNSAFLLPF